mgnify:CR=1 FL=1
MSEPMKPMEIEQRSFEIITELLGDRVLDPENELVIKRVIHTTADFDYADNLTFSDHAVRKGIAALKGGCDIVTDTQMALSGISKPALKKLGCQAVCFMADEDIAREAKARETTRARVSMERALAIPGSKLLVCGNAPTFLEPLENHADLKNTVVIGVPVGFVNVVESKELFLDSPVPHIIARGRKGGSNVAAAICNALLYQILR